MRLDREVVALFLLLADVEKADARVRDTQDALGVNARHAGELHEVGRLAVGVRAHVAQKHRVGRRGKGHGESRALHALHTPDHKRRSGEACARRPRGEEALCLALLHQAAADHDRGVLLLSHGAGGMLAHVDHLGGNVRLAAVVVRGERGHHLVGPAQNDFERRVGLKRGCDAFEHDAGRVVAAHSVNCENGSGKRLGRSTSGGQFARFPSQGELLSGRRDCTHLVKKPPVRAQGRTEMGGSRLAYVRS